MFLVLCPLGQLYGHMCQHDGTLIDFLPPISQIEGNGYLVVKVC